MVTLDQAGRASRWTRLVEAPRELKAYVEFLWIQADAGAGTGGVPTWRIVPDTAPHLVVKRLSDRPGLAGQRRLSGSRTRAVLVGARSRHVDSDFPCREWTVGVRFRPGTLPRLTGVPASDLTDAGVPLSSACGRAGGHLERALDGASCADEAVECINAMLLGALATGSSPDSRTASLRGAIQAATPVYSRIRPTTAAVAGSMGIAERTLRQWCADDIGLPPALAVRIIRLHHAIRLAIGDRRPGGWARIAAVAGYYDQSHLIRDFRLLVGETPRGFLARRGAERTGSPS
jgi:AraC-like DNA-binding protein